MIVELNARSKEVFRQIVDAYVATGEPVGSRTIARRLDEQISPATIRNVMADLEDAGLLYAPHTSAGRVPTDVGLRLYVDGLLEIGNVTEEERREIEGQCAVHGRSIEGVLSDASTRSRPCRTMPAWSPRRPTSVRSATSSSCRWRPAARWSSWSRQRHGREPGDRGAARDVGARPWSRPATI